MATQKRSRTGRPDVDADVDARPQSRLIQTRVPLPVYERVEKHARAEMVSIAAYVRRLIHNHTPGG